MRRYRMFPESQLKLLRGIAMVATIFIIAFIAVMQAAPDPVTGGLAPVTFDQVLLAFIFPGTMILGLIMAWVHHEGWGGALIVVSFPLFVLAARLLQGNWIPSQYFIPLWLLCALPGILFLIFWYLTNRANKLNWQK